MSITFNYKVFPHKVNELAKYKKDHPEFGFEPNLLLILIGVELVSLIATLFKSNTIWVWDLFAILAYFIINSVINDKNDDEHTLATIKKQKEDALREAEFYANKLNAILTKSSEIVNQILPYFESSAKQHIDNAKFEFSENAYSPFWSEVENASKFFAYYVKAIEQLSFNSEIYICTLKNLNHNFPIPFPFASNISISPIVTNEYKAVVRKAQTNHTFSIIWEQRRNSDILISGFTTLENAINNMNNDIISAINYLENSVNSRLDQMRFVQHQQLETVEKSQVYLNETLRSMDNKLYYIQWQKRPLGIFNHR